MKKFFRNSVIFSALLFSVLFFCAALIYYLTHRLFGNYTVNQALFHILHIKDMFAGSSEKMPETIKFGLAILILLWAGIIAYISPVLTKKFLPEKNSAKYVVQIFLYLLSGFLLVCYTNTTYTAWGWPEYEYLKNMFAKSDFIDSNYRIPEKITSTAEPKNLILIFAESLERDFAREDIFAENLLPHLSVEKGVTFRGYESLNGTDFTIAAQFAALCGLPLKDTLSNTDSAAVFLPAAVCISDVLKKSGYTNAFFKGASLKFSGTGKMLGLHSFDIAQGLNEFIQEKSVKPTQWQGWGLTDKDFFQLFQKKLTELAGRQKPFFAVGETVDTHFDTEYTSGAMAEYCPVKYKDMRDVIKCADKNISDFIHWFKKQSFAQNTVLVVIGDHLMMQSNISEYLNRPDRRETYNIIIGNGIEPAAVTKTFTQIDWAPTLLELTGHLISEADNRQFGLGVSLLSNNRNITEKYGIQKVNAEIYKRSKLYDSLQNSR